MIVLKDDPLDNLTVVVECTDRKEMVGIDLVKLKAPVLLTPSNNRAFFRLLIVARSC